MSTSPYSEKKDSPVRRDVEKKQHPDYSSATTDVQEGQRINASGHKDELRRHFNVWSTVGLALNIDSAWIALGGSIAISVGNGGPPGVIYELLVACFWYFWVGACIAELASSLPTAGGVYHWASIAPGARWGRVLGFFAGSLNFFGWLFAAASILQIGANLTVQLYAVYHPDFVIEAWHAYIAYVLITFLVAGFCVFLNRLIPAIQSFGLFNIVVGGIVTIIVVAAMPAVHAPTEFVWSDFVNATGWESNAVAFLIGCLNGAFTIGTVDAVTHLAEELPDPSRDLPKAIFTQLGLGTITSFAFVVAIMYGISDLDAVVTSNGSFPLAEVYRQATNSQGATFGLLFIVFMSTMICCLSTFLSVTRVLWALARDNVTPFSGTLSRVNHSLSCPVPAVILTLILTLGLGAISLGSKTAFLDLAGSFIILTTASYCIAIGAHLFTGRKNLPKGAFWMGKAGYFVQAVTLVLTIFFDIMFCFPFLYPADVATMNYNSVILVGVLFLTAVWWIIHGQRKYVGPKLAQSYHFD